VDLYARTNPTISILLTGNQAPAAAVPRQAATVGALADVFFYEGDGAIIVSHRYYLVKFRSEKCRARYGGRTAPRKAKRMSAQFSFVNSGKSKAPRLAAS
jgi:hypothetical protein